MSTSQPHAKSTTTPSKGLFAVLSGLLTSKGTTTPKTTPTTQAPARPQARHLPLATLAALALLTSLAFASSASAAPPTVATTGVSEVGYTSAKVAGTVTRDGADSFTSWGIQYSTEPSDPSKWVTGYQTGFLEALKGEFTAKPVAEKIQGLKPGTEYSVRLIAQNGFSISDPPEAVAPAPYPSFTTLVVDPPTIVATDNASNVFSTSARASGIVKRPANLDPAFDTSCRFEYITDAEFTANPPGEEFAGATVRQCNENPIGEADADKDKSVSALLGCTNPVAEPGNCLTAATTYHLRLIAENAGGAVTKDAASTFTTAPKVAAPTVLATDNAAEVGKRSAKATGKVERPAGADPALDVSCHFEFISDAQFTGNPPGEEFLGAGQAPCVENPITSPAPDYLAVSADVSAELAGLEPGTKYHLRLVAENGAGADTKVAASTFTTVAIVPPTLTVDPVTQAAYTSAAITGTVDPGNQGVIWGIEYSPAGQGEWSGYPRNYSLGEVSAGSPAEAVSANIPCAGDAGLPCLQLKPGTTYDVRLAGFDTEEFLDLPPQPSVQFTTKGTSAPPSATLNPITDFTATTAHLTGTVDPHAPAGPLDDEGKAVYKTKWHIECAPDCNDNQGNPLGGTFEAEGGAQPIVVDLKGLDPNIHYDVKLIVENGAGTGEAEQPFNTPLVKPTVKASPGGSDGKGGYILQGIVNPNNSPITDCKFAYGPNSGEELDDYPFLADCSPMPKGGQNEVQKITIDVPPAVDLSGEFNLTFRDQTTDNLPPDAAPAAVEAALEALTNVGVGNVAVTSSNPGGTGAFPGGPYEVEFKGSLAETNVPTIRIQNGPHPIRSVFGPGVLSVSTVVSGGNNFPVTVEAPLTGLTPGAHYNFRLFATNEAGEEKSENLEFTPTLADPEDCPNTQLRTENNSLALPECRAYEMVTPPGKEGFAAKLYTFDGGASVAYRSEAANIAKSGQNGPGINFYVATRSAAGWETIPNLNGSSGSLYDAPSNVDSDFVNTEFGGYSQDLRSSFWAFHRKGDPGYYLTTTYLNLRSPDGTFTPIGPLRAIRVAGSALLKSTDLSHLVSFKGPWGPGVYEFLGATTDPPRRVDLDNSGAPISTCPTVFGNANAPALSDDGTRVILRVFGGCGPDNPPAGEIWARVNGTTAIDVSASHCDRTASDPGGLCNGPTEPGGCVEAFNVATGDIEGPGCRTPKFAAATPDGSRVFFTTTQQLVDEDTDQTNDIYACDLPSGNPVPSAEKANHCASLRQVSAGNPTGATVELFNATSENGTTVLFTAKGVLADNEDALKEKAVAGDHNLYVWRTDAAHPDGQTAFIGRLDTSKGPSGNLELTAQATPDGRYLVFATTSQLVDTDTDTARDVYRYDAVAGTLTRVSTNVFGVAGNGDFDAGSAASAEHNPTATVSDDGTKIVFTTTEALSPVDGNAEPDVYLWTPARVSLISTGSSGSAPRGFDGDVLTPAAAIAPSGADIYFESAQALTPADPDNAADVYDARIGGGISFALKPVCTGEDCQPPVTPVPPNPKPSSSEPGPGNKVQPRPCPKGKVRKKNGKCVKKHKKHQKRSHVKAGHSRGGSK